MCADVSSFLLGDSADDDSDSSSVSFDGGEGGGVANGYDFRVREMVAMRLQTSVAAASEGELVGSVLELVTDLAKDPEALLRRHVASQIGGVIGVYLEKGLSKEGHAILGLCGALFLDPLEQVRQVMRESFVQLVTTGALPEQAVDDIVMSTVNKLLEEPNEKLHHEAVLVAADTAEFMSEAQCNDFFVPLFSSLLKDKFLVRRALPKAMVQVGTRVGPDVTDWELLPSFEVLVEDDIWSVRKACGECLASLAALVSVEVRRTKMTQFFDRLAQDESRWVQHAVFRSLAPLIAAYVPEPPAGNDLNVFGDEEEGSGALTPTEPSSPAEGTLTTQASAVELKEIAEALEEDTEVEELAADVAALQVAGEDIVEAEATAVSDSSFNSYDFWKTPLPAFDASDLLSDLNTATTSPARDTARAGAGAGSAQLEAAAIVVAGEENNVQPPFVPSAKLEANLSEATLELIAAPSSSDLGAIRLRTDWLHRGEKRRRLTSRYDFHHGECPVPDVLISYFNTMADHEATAAGGGNILQCCAFSFPAVCWAMGPERWDRIQKTYSTLASNDDWKIRSSLSYSIHIIAQIVGREVAMRDLLPCFDAFLKDWDEVRLGVVKNFASFLRVIPPAARQPYLPLLSDLRKTENSTNWRFRKLVATQLCDLCALYDAEESNTFICPIALELALDPVACVRTCALQALGGLCKSLFAANEQLARDFAGSVVRLFPTDAKSHVRQSYARLCCYLATSLPPTLFGDLFLRKLLDMTSDAVPNVRLNLARCLSQYIAPDMFAEGSSHRRAVEDALATLQGDEDRDVRYYAALPKGAVADPMGDLAMQDYIDE